MAMGIDEFGREFFQEVISEADAIGQFTADVFFEKFCDHLLAAGELDSADRASYIGPQGSGIRVDGYGGDPDMTAGTLTLIISDFNQSSETGRLVQGEMNALFQRLTKYLQKSIDAKWRNSLEETGPGFGLADLISQRWPRIERVRLFLISNRELSDRVDGRPAEEFGGRSITYNVWDLKRLHRFATVGHGHEEIDIDLAGDFGDPIAILPAHLTGADYESYLAVVPARLLGAIYDRWGPRLLEQNVRVFLQARGSVNKGIKRTLDNEPAMFFAYNNGITATAEAISIEETSGVSRLTRLKNLQIVNGGQTTASVHVAYRTKVDLSNVFIQMKLSVVDPERAGEIVPRISEYANSQNRVSAADFFANHPFHVRIEGFSRRLFAPSPDGTFRESKWFYERARGQFADARALLTPAQRKKFDLENPKAQLISKTDLAKFLEVWNGNPDKVSLGAQKNFGYFAQETGRVWKKDPDAFNEGWYQTAVAKAIIFKTAEKIVSSQSWYEGGYRANIVAYAIAKLAHDIAARNLSVDFDIVWRKQAIQESLENAIVIAATAVHEVLVNPPSGISNVTEWAKKQACWARVQELVIGWPEEFVADLISKDEKKAVAKGARKEQRVLNGIEAQVIVCKAGPEFWSEALTWGRERRLLSVSETSVLTLVSKMRAKPPTDVEAIKAMQALAKLNAEGYAFKL